MLFSLIIPVYNARAYLWRPWQSLKKQSYTHWQVIFVNDGSCDGSAELLENFRKEDPRVCVIHLKENQGQAHARNAGIKVAQGEWILFCDADDAYFEDALERLSAYACTQRWDVLYFNACVLYPSLQGKYNKDNCRKAHTMALWKKESFDSASKSYAESLLDINLSFKSPCTLALSRQWLEKVGILFQKSSLEDWLFNWELLAQRPRFYFLNEPLYQYFYLTNPRCLTICSQNYQENTALFDSFLVFKKGRKALQNLDEYPLLEERIYERGLETILGRGQALLYTNQKSERVKKLLSRYLKELHILLDPLSVAYRTKILFRYLGKRDRLIYFLSQPFSEESLRCLLQWYKKPWVRGFKSLKEGSKKFFRQKGVAQEGKELYRRLVGLAQIPKSIFILIVKLLKS